jgi:acyl-CoA synthetase (NDP forming)
LITHSGTVFDSVSQNNRDLHFNYLISAGNEAGLTAADYLHYVSDDAETEVAALYLETVRDPQHFKRALAHARRRDLPVVILKTGRSERGRQLAQAHSGALSGSAQTYGAVFRHFGVCQVHTLDEMMDTIELFSKVQAVRSPRLSVLMESGGERSLLVDIADDLGLALAEFSTETKSRLAEIVEPGVALENPLDAFGAGHRVVETYRSSLQALDADPQTGLNLLAVDLARFSYLSPAYTQAAIEAAADLQNPLIALVNVSAGANEKLMANLRASGIPVLMGTETGLKALRHLAAFSAYKPELLAAPTAAGGPPEEIVRQLRARIARAAGALGAYQSIELLSSYGLPASPMAAANSLPGVLESAAEIGYPLALKTAEPGVAHKSDGGGVRLDIKDQPALEAAYGFLREHFGPRVLLQPMVEEGVEMYFGMSRDPQFGAVLFYGLGGIHLELYRDVVAALPDLTTVTARQLLRELKGFPLLCGFRGGSQVDLDQLAGWMVRFAAFVRDTQDLLAEVDINPLIVTASGAQIVDALLVPRRSIP